jgi:uncharacterized protein GlcG (DUF336 family)
MRSYYVLPLLCVGALAVASCGESGTGPTNLAESTRVADFLPSHANLRAQLRDVLDEDNGGLGFDMWATILDRNGRVVDVVFSGNKVGDQWPGSRVISAQKANTANAFSLENFALSTANLYAAVQPGGSLFGLQESNPVNPDVAYAGRTADYGSTADPMIGKRIGGINVFGGGLALYSPTGKLLGGIGLSGDTACTDHIIAWKLRHRINLDNVPAGVADNNADDNIIFDTDDPPNLTGFEHPKCFDTPNQGDHVSIANDLPTTNPIGPEE